MGIFNTEPEIHGSYNRAEDHCRFGEKQQNGPCVQV
jgi:hypothetical protein